MKVNIVISKNFKTEAKPLQKKFPSLNKDLLELESSLQKNPRTGIILGSDVYKIRLKITSKGKGKSGGARVVTFVETILIGVIEHSAKETTVTLLSIYDKSITASISDEEIKRRIKNLPSKK